MHVTGEQAKHFAYVISECSKRNIRTVEPTEAAEKEWCDTIVAGTAIRAEFFKECTPGYYNNEGKPSMTAARNATYGGGSPAFLKILTDWRKANDLKGLDVRSFDRKEEETAPEEQAVTAKAPEQNSTEHIEAVSAIPLTNGSEDKETEGKTAESSPQGSGPSLPSKSSQSCRGRQESHTEVLRPTRKASVGAKRPSQSATIGSRTILEEPKQTDYEWSELGALNMHNFVRLTNSAFSHLKLLFQAFSIREGSQDLDFGYRRLNPVLTRTSLFVHIELLVPFVDRRRLAIGIASPNRDIGSHFDSITHSSPRRYRSLHDINHVVP
jgi:hypothetical protein